VNPLALAALEDVQGQVDDRGVYIDEVGVADLRMPVEVAMRDGSQQATVANVEMAVDLAGDIKGTHMSRFVDIFHNTNEVFSPASVMRLAEEIRARLDSERAVVRMQFPFFVVRDAPVTGRSAPVEYEARVDASVGQLCELRVGVRTPVTSLCPCSKEISDYGAHNQRGYVEIDVTCPPETAVCFEDLIEIAEQAGSSPVYSMLKRPDERHVTMQAYESPAFVEDIARDAALLLKDDQRVSSFTVRVTNLESIHTHNAVATVRGRRA
jgi:GTP cyclohydrolase IB